MTKKLKPRSNGKHPGGRPPKMDPAVVEKVTQALRLGAPKETAAVYAGIAKDTYHAWMQRGGEALRKAGNDASKVPDEDRPWAEFSVAVEKAFSEGELSLLGVIHRAARPTNDKKGEWAAAAWLLERTRQAQYARRMHAQVEGVPGGAPIVVQKVDVAALALDAEPDDGEEA